MRPRAAEVVGPYGKTGRFPHLAGTGALTRPPQRIPPTRRGGYQPPVSNRVLFTVGPVWDRPLRRSSDRFLHFRRGGTPGRPETARWGHRALRKIKRTFGYAVGAGPRPARRFWTYAGAHSVRPRAARSSAPTAEPKDSPSRRGGYPHPPASEDSSTRRGGTLGRPETARWGHRALQKIKRTFGYAVGAGPCGRPQFYCVHTGKGGNKHSLKHKNTGGPAGPPVFYFSFCSFIIATFRTISSR